MKGMGDSSLTSVCHACGEGFLTEGDVQRMRSRLDKDFPAYESKDCGVVCPSCYGELLKISKILGLR